LNSNLPIGGLAAAILVIFFRLPAHVKPAEATFREKMLQLDPIGIVLIMAAVICYVLALQWGGLTHPWSSSTIIGLFVGFGLLLLCFCFDQWYMEERAMLPKRLLKDRYIHQGMAYSFTIAGTYFLVLYFLPIYFQVIDNVSPIESGVRNLPLILAITLATIVSGIGITVTGRPMPFMIVAGAVYRRRWNAVYTYHWIIVSKVDRLPSSRWSRTRVGLPSACICCSSHSASNRHSLWIRYDHL
jgi:MFS family permease